MHFSKTLYGLDKNGGFKIWTIVARQYFDAVVDRDKVVIEVFHGKEDGKIQKKTEFVNEGKQGRNAYEQAVSQAEGKIKKQLDKGYRENKSELEELPLIAMLAGDYNKIGHRIKFPCYVSDKFDGVRCLAKCTYDDERQHSVVTLESRTGQPYDVPHLVYQLTAIMSPGEVYDGEIYLHGYELQDITSAVKRTNTQEAIDKAVRKWKKAEESGSSEEIKEANLELNEAELIHKIRPRLEFHVFDVPGDLDFLSRYLKVCELHVVTKQNEFIFAVGHKYISSEKEMFKAHADAVSRGYEGIMIRNFSGMYESGKRSADLQKYKTFIDAEFRVIGHRRDKDNLVVYVCRNDVNDHEFSVILGTKEERANPVDSEWLNVKFQSRYKDTLLPQFPTGQYFRTCDANGNPVE